MVGFKGDAPLAVVPKAPKALQNFGLGMQWENVIIMKENFSSDQF